MTLQELYESIGGNYEQALRVLRVDKLVDKHIRKFEKNGVVEALLAAGEAMEPTQMSRPPTRSRASAGIWA